MEGVNPVDPPKPCQYFHMIGGTSTGGLIALMLGRMRLSVDDCIDAYTELSPKIFTKLHHRVKLSTGQSQGRFDHRALEHGIKEILKKYGFAEDTLFKEPLDAGTCKT
jgi:patatin-like phospholipase/acyl hydrolase